MSSPATDSSQKMLHPGAMPKSVWAIGGGKGGTGKTFVASSLGLHLAREDTDVVMVDADLGAPNAHTFLGVQNPRLTLADFVYKKVPSLSDVLTDTPYPRLKLVAGSNRRLYMANLAYFQKQRLLRHIKSLDHTHTIVDTGAGTHFNCIDFFPIADLAILVVNPNPASIENAYQFLRSVTLRILKFSIRRNGMADLVKQASASANGAPESINSLVQLVKQCDQHQADILLSSLQQFRPCLIVNKVRGRNDALLGRSMAQVVERHLAVHLHYVGMVPYDPDIESCMKSFTPYVHLHPHSKTSYALRVILDRLVAHQRLPATGMDS